MSAEGESASHGTASSETVAGGVRPAVAQILRHFDFGHLPVHLAAISGPVHELAHDMASRLNGPELTAGLRHLRARQLLPSHRAAGREGVDLSELIGQQVRQVADGGDICGHRSAFSCGCELVAEGHEIGVARRRARRAVDDQRIVHHATFLASLASSLP